jgi:predicted ATPase/DNA-binding CsgD family transcriptional regulator
MLMGNVPPEPSSFVGRAAELIALGKVQVGARLLTIVGPAGVGKTRLGLRLAASLGGSYPDGVWFVDLASVADTAMVAHTVARVLEVRQEPGQSALQALAGRLQNSQLLLILDNCEAVLDACAKLAPTLCDSCPRLHLLAISREPMETAGDTIWRVPPLSLPGTTAGRAEVASSEAVKLFVTRARARDSQFSVTTANCAEIGALCRQLGGLPLALELVAARTWPSPGGEETRQLRLELAREVRGGRHRLQQQQILRTTLDWAHSHLTPSQRMLFRRLGVFAGNWSLDIARVVCADEHLSAGVVATELERLVDASLVVVEPQAAGTQYRLLDTVRGYAREQLRAAAELDALHLRLLMQLVYLTERVPPEALDPDHAALLEANLENVRTAMFWALTNGEAEYALRLATGTCSLWYFRGYYVEGCDWLERGLAVPWGAHTVTRARAAAWLGQLLQFRGEYTAAERWITHALEQHQALGDPLGCALSLGMLGQLVLMRGDLMRARGLCAEASERLTALDHSTNVASRLQSAIIAIELADFERANEVIGRCEAQPLESQLALAAWLRFLKGRLAEATGDLALAHSLLLEALQMSRTVPDQQATVTVLIELGHTQLERDSTAEALVSFAEAVELAQRSGERTQLARALEGVARSVAADQPAAAIRLAGAADRLRSAMGAIAWPSDRRRLAVWLPDARRSLKPRQYRAAWPARQASDVGQAVALARSLATAHASPARGDVLTLREQQVVALLAGALTTRQIATQLCISPATARTHVEHVLAKLGLHTRAQVVFWANQRSMEVTLASTVQRSQPGSQA